MVKHIGRWFEIHENEIGLFLWTCLLLFLIRSSGILLNNFAETAFLKRYGVEYLPIVNMINALATFFIMGIVTGLMTRMDGVRLFTWLFIFCGLSVAAIRLIIPFGIDLVYPLLFMLKSQYEVLLALLFWNMANDMFNTRQAKRLFPLVTAGGVIGQILSSFATPFLARWIMMDNLLFVYLGTTLAGAVVVGTMGRRFPTLFVKAATGDKQGGKRSVLDQFKDVVPLIKQSGLIKILVLLTFVANVMIPIMNYQFNYALDEQFASEGKLIEFFGYFRGVLNILSLILLLFIKRLYSRWGLPVALMFHPFNYVLIFISFLLRFDIFTAIYARFSSTVLRTTINVPSLAILNGLFPKSYRSLVRPFLRGTVVRIALLMSNGMILLSTGLFHPKYLSLVALPFGITWVATTFYLKKRYPQILMDLVTENMIDLKSMKETELSHLFNDPKIKAHLMNAFTSASGEKCLWHAELLKLLNIPGLDPKIISVLEKKHDEKTRIGLIRLLSPAAGKEAVDCFTRLALDSGPKLMTVMIQSANRQPSGAGRDFNEQVMTSKWPYEVKAYAAAGIFRTDPADYGLIIDGWLESENMEQRKAGIIAAGQTGANVFARKVTELLNEAELEELIPLIIKALRRMEASDLNREVSRYLDHKDEDVRLEAVKTLKIRDDAELNQMLHMVEDASEDVNQAAHRAIVSAAHQNIPLLLETLSSPRRSTREGILGILESMDIKDIDVVRFARGQTRLAYENLIAAGALDLLPAGPAADLLNDHLQQQALVNLEIVLRVLAAHDPTGRIRILTRTLFYSDSRQTDNSLEALDSLLPAAVFQPLLPLLEKTAHAQPVSTARKFFKLPDFTSNDTVLVDYLANRGQWLEIMLMLAVMKERARFETGSLALDKLTRSLQHLSGGTHRKRLHSYLQRDNQKEISMESAISLTDKILLVREIDIFSDLSVSELAAVASVTEAVSHPANQVVIREGDRGETLFLIVKGSVAVIKNLAADNELELDQIDSGDYFGEMALFEDQKRSASIRTLSESEFLVLHKAEFNEIVHEFPEIALNACRVLSTRIRRLHARFTSTD
jgi:hypothetical protein